MSVDERKGIMLVIPDVCFKEQRALFAGEVYPGLVVLNVLLHLNSYVLQLLQQICHLTGKGAGVMQRCTCVRVCVCVCVPCALTHGLTTVSAALYPRSF